MFPILTWILGVSVDDFFRGVSGASGILVLCHVIRVHVFTQSSSDEGNKERSSRADTLHKSSWRATVQFWSMTLLLTGVGPRVSSLIVLEFSLRAVSAKFSAKQDARESPELLLLQSQFSMGCGLSCTLWFLHQGAPNGSYSLFLVASFSWLLAGYCKSLWSHVALHYRPHSSERSCGKCVSLLTSGHDLLASLQQLVILVFALAAVASSSVVFDNFLQQKDALKLWTPLTLCYSLLLVYIQEGRRDQTPTQALLHNVVLRLGALLVLMLTVGHWSDVLQVLLAALGEAVCLLPSADLLKVVFKDCEDSQLRSEPTRKCSRPGSSENKRF